MDHGEVGGLSPNAGSCPQASSEAIRYHHSPGSSREHAPLAELVAVADFVTYASSLGEISNGREPILPAATTLPIVEEDRSSPRIWRKATIALTSSLVTSPDNLE